MDKKLKYDYLYKLLILGGGAIGKTSILLRFTDGSFMPNQLITIGIDFKIKYVHIFGKLIKLQIWDTPGKERFRITKTYYKGAHGIIILYDVSDIYSFEDVRNYWFKELKKANVLEKVDIFLVGNKIDKTDRVISKEEGEKLAEEFGIRYYECSAKDNYNIDFIFNSLVKRIALRYFNEKNYDNYDISYKISILGDESTGKTCILKNYLENKFIHNDYSPTKVTETKSKIIENNDGNLVKLQLYDTPGNNQYHLILKDDYKDSNGIILIYDVTNKNSFNNLKNWIKEIKKICSKNTPIFIVGNKIDDDKNRIIALEEGKKLVQEYGLIFCECSAKTGENIHFIFWKLTEKINEISKKIGNIKENKEKQINFDYSFKISILGDKNTGKSNLINCNNYGFFVESYYSQIDEIYEVFSNNVRLDDIGKTVNLKILDASSEGKYHLLLKDYYKDSNGIILMYDVTNKNSFHNLENWIKEIKIVCSKNTPIFIVGNKIDDDKNRIITLEEGKKLAQEYGLIFFECSCKNLKIIDFIFKKLIMEILKAQITDGITLQKQLNEKYDYFFKISLLGDNNAGKSCFLNYIRYGLFVGCYSCDKNEYGRLFKNVENTIMFHIYNKPGNNKYYLLLKDDYKDSNGIILIYDVTNKNSFNNLENWIKEIKNICSRNTPIFIVGNKIDDDKNRIITIEEGKKVAKEYDLLFSECSAKTGENIDFIFEELGKNILKNKEKKLQITLNKYLSF